MKTIIAGSRTVDKHSDKYNILVNAIKESGFEITEVITGMANGPDKLGLLWAIENNIPFKKFPAQWGVYGKKAGFLRNIQMLQYADALIAIWDKKSKGTKHTIDSAKAFNIPTYVKIIEDKRYGK